MKGTVISQPFDSSKLVGGISGSLRQEFRELELLDDITKMRWEGNSHPSVTGVTRSELIHNFRKWKGKEYIPKHVHQSLSWASSTPSELLQREGALTSTKFRVRAHKNGPIWRHFWGPKQTGEEESESTQDPGSSCPANWAGGTTCPQGGDLGPSGAH